MYIEDANEKIKQFQFFDGGLLTSTFYNSIIIIFLTVVVKYFQTTFTVKCICDALSIFIILHLL